MAQKKDKQRAITIADIEAFNEVLEEIAHSSKSVKRICDEKGVAFSLFWKYKRENADFAHEYARAKLEQIEFLAEEIIEIADHTDEDHTPFTGSNVVKRDALKIDSRKWLLSKLLPKKYGDKIDVTTNGDSVNKIVPSWMEKKDD